MILVIYVEIGNYDFPIFPFLDSFVSLNIRDVSLNVRDSNF